MASKGSPATANMPKECELLLEQRKRIEGYDENTRTTLLPVIDAIGKEVNFLRETIVELAKRETEAAQRASELEEEVAKAEETIKAIREDKSIDQEHFASKARVAALEVKAELDDKVDALESKIERLRSPTGIGSAFSNSSGIITVRKKAPPKGFQPGPVVGREARWATWAFVFGGYFADLAKHGE